MFQCSKQGTTIRWPLPYQVLEASATNAEAGHRLWLTLRRPHRVDALWRGTMVMALKASWRLQIDSLCLDHLFYGLLVRLADIEDDVLG